MKSINKSMYVYSDDVLQSPTQETLRKSRRYLERGMPGLYIGRSSQILNYLTIKLDGTELV